MRRYIVTVKQFIGFGFSVLLLAAMFAFFSFAQNKPAQNTATTQAPQAYRMSDWQIKPEMGLEWADFLKNELNPALRKAGYKQWFVWRTAIFGQTGRYLVGGRMEGLAQLDEQPSPVVKAIGQEAATKLAARLMRFMESSRSFSLTPMADLSILPKTGYAPKLAVMVINTVAPSRTAEYEKGVKEMVAAIGKTNVKGLLVGRIGLGGNPNEYILTALFDNFADLEKFPQAMAKAAAEVKLAPAPAGIVTRTEYDVMSYVPEASIEPTAQ
jgi:hypothetical protein